MFWKLVKKLKSALQSYPSKFHSPQRYGTSRINDVESNQQSTINHQPSTNIALDIWYFSLSN